MTPDIYKASARKFREEIGLLIKNARKDLPQGKLAKRIGLTRTSVNNIEHGRQGITLDTLLLISCILKVSIIELLPKNFEMIPSVEEKVSKEKSKDVKEFIKNLRENK